MTYRVIDVSQFDPVAPADQPAPQVMWVEIGALVIDDRYQRPIERSNRAAILRIAGDFRWSRFSPVLVSPIEGGRYAVIDGQHRVHAAAICGFRQVPAMIVLVDPREQARAFVEINTRQIRVSGYHLLRAALNAGEPWAVSCRRAVEAAGCQLMLYHGSSNHKKPGQVYAVQLVRSMIQAGYGAAVTRGLRALLDFDPDSAANFDAALLTPWLGAVAAVPLLEVDDLVAVLRAHRPWIVLEQASRRAKADAVPVARARREAFVALLSQALRDRGAASGGRR